ncbi:MAG: MFS transporter [Candidatus Bathyarchaeia archaeon]
MLKGRELFLVASVMASFLTPFIAIAVNIALPSISNAFNVDLTIANWVANSYLISMASTILLIGAVADWIGKEPVFVIGAIIFAATSFLTPYSGSFALLIVLRCLQGIGSAMISGTAVAILASIFPEKTGFAIGLNTAAVYVGTTLGPSLGGFLVDYAGWRSLFILVGAVALLSAILAPLAVDVTKKSLGRKPRFQTLLIFAISAILVTIGSSYISSLHGSIILSLGLIAFISTLYIEYEKTLNLIKEIFGRKVFLAYITALLNYVATYALSILFSNFLQVERGFKAREAGIILLAQPLPQMLLSPVAGHLADKLNPSLLTAVGMALIVLGIGSSVITYKWLISLIVSLFLIGIGFAFFASPNTTQVMHGVPREAFALASSFLGLMRFLGQSLSTSILTASMLALKPFIVSMETVLLIYAFIAACGTITAIFSAYQ